MNALSIVIGNLEFALRIMTSLVEKFGMSLRFYRRSNVEVNNE